MHRVLCTVWPCAYGWARARAPCSNLGERPSTGRVDCAVANPVPPVLLPSSQPHDDFSIKVLGGGIVLWPMDLPCHRCVLSEAGVDGRVVVRLGRVLWVVVDVGRRLALVDHCPCLELGDGRSTM